MALGIRQREVGMAKKRIRDFVSGQELTPMHLFGLTKSTVQLGLQQRDKRSLPG